MVLPFAGLGSPEKAMGWLPLRFRIGSLIMGRRWIYPSPCTFHLQCRYRLSSGNGDTSSSEEDRYDRKEAKIYGKSSGSSSASKAAADTTAKVATVKGKQQCTIVIIKYNT